MRLDEAAMPPPPSFPTHVVVRWLEPGVDEPAVDRVAVLERLASQPFDLLVDGHAAGSISMAAYTVGLDCDTTRATSGAPAAALPDGFPTLDSNL